MRVADLFCGAGGFTLGATQAGLTPVFAANHWDEAIHAHTQNHPGVRHVEQDLQEADLSDIGDPDLLLASPPCPAHSSCSAPARKGTGGNGTVDVARIRTRSHEQRNSAWAVVTAAEHFRPPTILVENVPGFARWVLFPAWLGALQALGYHTRVHQLNARDYGAPQDRARCVISARLDSPLVLAPACDTGAPRRSIGDCLDRTVSRGWKPSRERRGKTGPLIEEKQAQAGLFEGVLMNAGDGVRMRPLDDVFPTITTKSVGQIYYVRGPESRLITAREAPRAQGFPDDFQLPKQKGLAGMLVGNAIPVDLARGVCSQARDN